MKIAQGTAFHDPREHIGIPDPPLKGGLFVSARESSQPRMPQNEWTIPYLLYAYEVKLTTFQRRLHADNQGPTQVHKTVFKIYQHTVLEVYQHTALGLVKNINPAETPSCGLTLA
jgi:hypothetical protein